VTFRLAVALLVYFALMACIGISGWKACL